MVPITRSDLEIRPDPKRVVARPFLPGGAAFVGGPSRVELIARRVLSLSDIEAKTLLEQTRSLFESRHRDLESVWRQNAGTAEDLVPSLSEVEGDRRDLIGAFFTQEYNPEAAAVCNPSMVPFPGSGNDGRFVMSVRAIGEGHISSVEFRTGSVDDSGRVALDEPSPYLTTGERRAPQYTNAVFRQKLEGIGGDPELVDMVMEGLADRFTSAELDSALEVLDR
ncbi:MAG TPA: glycosidase, partial [Acidimicrobiia bacterium]|nr:glycosidase [Acidimicrobiia bacterium]